MKAPKGWKIRTLEEVAGIQTGLSKSASRTGDFIRLPYLRVANVQDGHFDLSEIKEIDVPKESVDRFRVAVGDLLLTEGGDFDKLGRGAIWKGAIPNCVHQNHIFVVRANESLLDRRFLAMQTQGAHGRAYFQSCSKQSTNLASINSSQLKQFPVLLAPLPEQQKIADILGTWDDALEKLDALIVAKDRRKQTLMQQLLTGKRRLKGAVGAWRWERLDSLCEPIERTAPAGIERVLSITAGRGFQDQREKFSRVIAGRNIENYIHLKRGEFAYNKGNSDRYPQGCVYQLEEYDEGAVPNVWISFSIKNGAIGSEFLKQFFLAGGHNHQLSRLINYGVRNDGLLNLTADAFFAIKIPVPPADEQTCIGDFCESLAAEIHLLRQQRAALDHQKRGLMQQLLTGRIRTLTK